MTAGDGQPAEDGLGRRVVSGARWVVLLRVGSMGTTWIIAIALARLLDRSQYGLVGMANILITFLIVFQDSGLQAALIQRSERFQEAVDTAAVYAAVSGVALAGFCLVAAPLAGHFFHRGEVTDLVRGLSVVFLFRGFSKVPQAIMQKELRFRPLVIVVLTGSLLQAGAAISLGASGAGAWSAVGGAIVLEGWCALLMWPICDIRPNPRRASWRTLRELLSYGRSLVGFNLSNMLYSYVDLAVIGRNLGPASLGAYTIGYQTGKLPVANVTYASNQLIFPAYAKLKDDPDRFRRAYLRSLRFVTTVSVPIGFGLAALSGPFVHVIYGERWSSAAPVLAIMALAGVVLSVTATMGDVMKTMNRAGLLFRLSLLETGIVIVAVLLLYPHGIAAVAAGVAGAVTFVGVLATRVTARLLAIGAREWMATLLPAAAAGGVMAAGVVGTRLGLHGLPPALVLAVTAVEGVVLFIVALGLIASDRLREFLRELERLSAISSLVRRLRRDSRDSIVPGETVTADQTVSESFRQ